MCSGRSPSYWCQPWLPASVVATGGTLTYRLSATPDPGWASTEAADLPSYGSGRLPAVGFTSPGGGTTVAPGQPAVVTLGVQPAVADPSTVVWTAGGSGLTVVPNSGTLAAGSPPGGSTQVLTVRASGPGTHVLEVQLRTSGGTALPPVDVELHVTG